MIDYEEGQVKRYNCGYCERSFVTISKDESKESLGYVASCCSCDVRHVRGSTPNEAYYQHLARSRLNRAWRDNDEARDKLEALETKYAVDAKYWEQTNRILLDKIKQMEWEVKG